MPRRAIDAPDDGGSVLLSLFLTCVVSLGISTLLLVLLGHRVRFSSRVVGILLAVAVTLVAGEAAARLWNLPSGYVEAAEVALASVTVVWVALRPQWNPIGQVFYGSLLTSVATYLVFAGDITFAFGLSVLGVIASTLLLLMELAALVLSTSFAVESLDYPDFEVIVIDNNTKDRQVWQPVYDFCREPGHERVKFVHVDDWPGYKSGALNLVLREYTDPDAELVGVVDADYLLDPQFLRKMAGYFADPSVAFVQGPQDYGGFEGDPYHHACAAADNHFFTTTMPSRNRPS